MLGLCVWLISMKTLPWAYTLAFGRPYESTQRMRTDHVYSRRTCDHRLKGRMLEHNFPSYLCISEQAYWRYPDREVRVRLVGLESPLGIVVWGIYLDQ